MAEANQGDPEAASKRIAAISDIPELEITEEVLTLGKILVTEGPIPEKATMDAFHIAVATVNGIDYLLTWNCVHIANAILRPKIEMICRNQGYEPPVICTPQQLMEG